MPARLLIFGRALFAIAALSICGGHWAVFQAVAWSSMLLQNSREADLTEAVTRTFDGQHPCDLCQQIKKGRQTEEKPERQLQLVKLTLFHEATTALLWMPPPRGWQWRMSDTDAVVWSEQPRLQPPRAARG